jgi:hypothetical protein
MFGDDLSRVSGRLDRDRRNADGRGLPENMPGKIEKLRVRQSRAFELAFRVFERSRQRPLPGAELRALLFEQWLALPEMNGHEKISTGRLCGERARLVYSDEHRVTFVCL